MFQNRCFPFSFFCFLSVDKNIQKGRLSSDLCGYKGVVSLWDPATNGFPVTTEISEYKEIECCMIEGVVSLQ